jgi:ArsR family transcriptional regulator, nickel/cobalt-responsive transcriptional repressor
MIEKEQANAVANTFGALSDKTRIQIVVILGTGASTVTELAKQVGTEIVNVSHHLGVLRAGGIVEVEKNGRYQIYTLNPALWDGNTINVGGVAISFPISKKKNKVA